MSDVHPVFGRLMTAEEYAREWEANADHFVAHGYYAMPLEHLGAPRTVLEIGCGSGRSTLALAQAGHNVVAVEINAPAARQAGQFLTDHGIEAVVADAFPAGLDDPASLPAVTIVVGDIFAEGALGADIAGKFDAVLCWFIGAHLDVIAEHAGKPRMDLTGDDVRQYRLSLQSTCYAIGRHALRSGGQVQVVDRMRLLSWMHRKMAGRELAEMQAGIAGDHYAIDETSARLAKVTGEFQASGIQYLSERPDAHVRVVSSVIATLAGDTD